MTTAPTFETDRLIATAWNGMPSKPVDKGHILTEMSQLLTPPVLQPLPDSLKLGPGDTAIEEWISARAEESQLVIIRKKDQAALIGLIILAQFEPPGQPPLIHLGYLLAQSAWGQGFATEIVGGLIGHYRAQLQPVDLVAGVESSNKASARVLEKCGFEHLDGESGDQQSMFRLAIRA